MTPMPWTLAHDRVALHVPVVTVPEPQQGWPRAPQAVHADGPAPGSTQAKPVLQVPLPPPQHGWPEPPHAAHVMPPSAPAPHAPPV